MQTLATLLLVSGCSGGDTNFQRKNQDPATQAGTGVADIYPSSLVFEDLSPTIAHSEFVKITNAGEEELQVYEIDVIDSGGGVFVVEDIAAFELNPEASREFVVVATLPDEASATGILRIKTSDQDALNFELPLEAHSGEVVDTADTGKGKG